jgi:hypothetical protein
MRNEVAILRRQVKTLGVGSAVDCCLGLNRMRKFFKDNARWFRKADTPVRPVVRLRVQSRAFSAVKTQADKSVRFTRSESGMRAIVFIAALGLSVAIAPIAMAAAPTTNRFGFAGPEIFRIENQIGQLRAADLDGDGLNDLVVANNARSKITILYNRTG